ncbi:MAG: hypothetical protein GPJ27_19230 [Microcystis aeruginosa L111-01]|jgi:Uma2 family endonuclease|nr:hypothetical protein [Microcystis aeruginosa W13-16]NCQ75659.1 hypothetical protein [Microcystis aeruginosa W13-13]NCQ80124.1 hypothetical protein [Microcystis aeruginosa W13-15]NCR14357.1 hypothetical protein [Microcystis aeruginosa SX13-11]NCR18601.1 hypothetical protein [Microcystis aeruginosa LL13-03]NCR23897.1 hypothetical protein [Microcystis aeruginosa L111-01]NCR46565.1 hypothetical protein [Microcystis aeruginosa SX13-01]NCR68261.1 hypothetical protein [Microcystis aeruginosa LL1
MVNLTYNKNRPLPSAEELPSSDETPVDNQLQNDIPNLLLQQLALIWSSRDDWYFGVDMAVYYNPEESAFVPDGFLAVGVNHDTGAYFVASCGGVTVEQLKKYVENQNSPKVETLPR